MALPYFVVVLAVAAGVLLAAAPAQAGGTVTVGMTAGDLPITTGNPDQGFEGYRFVGYNLYDSLVLWDLSKSDKVTDIKPGLATEWQVDEASPKRWIFKLRQGVKWHDGCDFTADDVVWNLSHSTNDTRRPSLTPRNSPRRAPTSAILPAFRRSTITPWRSIPRSRIRCSPMRSAMC